jgi:hypothetical protein
MPQHDADVSAGSIEWPFTRDRIPLLRRNDRAERSAFRLPREKPDCGDGRTGRTGMRHGRGFRIPVLPSASSVVPARSGSMSCEAGGREAGRAEVGRF